ncbi:mobilization protein [Wohlfahrtiimonas chitiniclastica]|nr:mobilization protein [Wohlfahrtiimonas chitiniclastica]MBS7841135.1 mobilization protein [Wohlfahrtiimonas chitiniclastica]
MNEKINKIDERIQKQEEEIKRLKALKRKAESTMKAKERERQRKNDTRRKILIGACMMKLADENQDEKERLLKQLDKFLINEKDRSLFNL